MPRAVHPRRQEAIDLVLEQGKSYGDAAEIIGIGAGNRGMVAKWVKEAKHPKPMKPPKAPRANSPKLSAPVKAVAEEIAKLPKAVLALNTQAVKEEMSREPKPARVVKVEAPPTASKPAPSAPLASPKRTGCPPPKGPLSKADQVGRSKAADPGLLKKWKAGQGIS